MIGHWFASAKASHMMTSRSSPEAPQSHQDELEQPQTQVSGTSNEPPVQINFVPEPTPKNVDTKADQVDKDADLELVPHHRSEKNKGEVSDHKDPVQELKARINAMEQRLVKAGLLKNPKGKSRKKTGSSSSPRQAKNKPDVDQTEQSLKETKDPEESVQILMDRIDSFERRLKESGHLKEEPAAGKPRLPAIPQLHYVEWSEFKNKYIGEEQDYAIEVLVGGAKYYHQRSEEERKHKQRLKNNSNDRDPLTTGHESSSRLPERIRINSKPILLIMNQVDPMDWSEYPIVMLRPFKPLIYHEVRIREIFQRLLTKWGNADKGSDTEQPVEPTITSYVGNNTVPAVSEGDMASVPAESGAGSKFEAVSSHLVGSDDHTVSPPNVATTRSTRIYPSLTVKSLQPLHSISNNSIERNATMEAEEHSAQFEIVSEGICDEEAEDLADSPETLRDLRCLIEFIDVELRPVADSYRNMTNQKVPFCDLWHLFKPGDLVHGPTGNRTFDYFIHNGEKVQQGAPNDAYQEVWRVACTTGGRPHLEAARGKNRPMENHLVSDLNLKSVINPFLITAVSVDFNGTRYVNQMFEFAIVPFDGERDITSLQVYPLRYAPQVDELKDKWKSRGEAFLEYTTFKYRYYAGKTLTCSPRGFYTPELDYPKHAENIDSQVVVDFGEAFAAHPGWRSSWESLPRYNDADAPGEVWEDYPTSYWKDSARKLLDEQFDDDIYGDGHIDTNLMGDYIERDPLLRDYQKNSAANDALDESHLMLLPNRVFAFVMKSRKWAMVTVDGLRPVKRNDGGLKDLQLPMGHKRTIGSLVGNHFINRNAHLDDLEESYHADLVRGKGKGLVILLHGAPGVGKTSTAETVADAFGKMLLPITCGDLGLTAAHVEQELSDKFHLAEIWDCVLLLDEADVFLARRTNTDIKRNSLVSVFLRILEHFTGVLFLTTNRVGAFDEAFKSRIHIKLYYPPLDAERTLSLWRTNLERLKEKKQRRNESMLFNENEIIAYAQSHYTKTSLRGASWNGRQIRNAFQTASALAEFEARENNKRKKARSVETGEAFIPIDPELHVKHFKEIAGASYEFDEYISETKGFTEAELAHLEGQRLDEYQPSRRLARDREQQPVLLGAAPARIPVPSHVPRPRMSGQTSAAGSMFAGRTMRVNARPLTDHIYDEPEGQASQYDRPPVRRNIAPLSRSERSSTARPRPTTVQQSSAFATHDRERQRQAVFSEPTHQYEYQDQQDTEYEQGFEGEGTLSQPLSTHAYLEAATRHEASPSRRQAGDFAPASRMPAYAEDFHSDEEVYDM